MNERDIIKKSPLFAGFGDSQLDEALALYKAKRAEYPRGAALANAGDKLECFGLVLSGGVQVSAEDVDGNTVIMAAVGPGGMFGESLCWLAAPAIGLRITAVSETRVLWLSPDFMRGDAKEPCGGEHRRRFVNNLATRTLYMNSRVQVLARSGIRGKLALFFKQYGSHGGAAFEIPFDRESLAAYLGVNRSALSRELANMKREGLIDYYKNSFRLL
ncbi:MAG: Crp/Fnr family transcriptional regulator [Clostridia bacterium]|nr:Crp/Fnr family transcriptional regulator [Clostridia bacterium]